MTSSFHSCKYHHHKWKFNSGHLPNHHFLFHVELSQVMFIFAVYECLYGCVMWLIIWLWLKIIHHPLFASWSWTITTTITRVEIKPYFISPSNKNNLQQRQPCPFFPPSTCQGAPCCRISAVNLLMAWSTSPRWTGPWSRITWTKEWV